MGYTVTEFISSLIVLPLLPADRRYITWLSLVTIAINYNIWFLTVRMCFPYHTETAVPYWFTVDLLADLIYLMDSVFFQPRKQFLKGGDIIVGPISIIKGHVKKQCVQLNVCLNFRKTE